MSSFRHIHEHRELISNRTILFPCQVQVRRVKVEDLWDKSGPHFSFAKLSSMVADFMFPATMKDSQNHEQVISIAETKDVDNEDVTKDSPDYRGEDGNITVPSDDGWEKGSDSYELFLGEAESAYKKELTNANIYLAEDRDKLTITSHGAWESANNNSVAQCDTAMDRSKCTYIDEDGEVITISTNSELEDAFRQFFKKYHVYKKAVAAAKRVGQKVQQKKVQFRITMTIPKD